MKHRTLVRILIDDYSRRIKTISDELSVMPQTKDNIEDYRRLKIKRSCYVTFISELTKIDIA